MIVAFAPVSSAADDELELDELWSFVLKKIEEHWLWTALCRRTRKIVAHVIEDRSEQTCQKLWKLIPEEYKGCRTYSDLWDAYEKAFPKENPSECWQGNWSDKSHGTLE